MSYRNLSTNIACLIGAGLLVGLSGCSTAFNPIGSNSYDCNRKQDPSSIYCHSFKSVEASTNGELPDSRFDQELKFSQYDKATEIAPVGASTGAVIKGGAGESIAMGSSPLAQLGGPSLPPADDTPVRAGPVIQRTWIKHFVNANDARIGDTVVYKEVVPTHWVGFDGGDPQSVERGMYPHKVQETKTAMGGLQIPPSLSRPLSSQTDFIQPGTAPAPSENPGSPTAMSMPQ
ncbi:MULTISPECIES: TraV family lipoprotein [Paraburkholderia]|uniref:TraV family lipoprotein n=1 Tax=Paraburkholderia madseniana TaxID=2599607 RepID=A0AAP5BJQ7_9BURK|nr:MULTISPECIES: TraV family lipoprotein [Paraburkholderia]MCX4151034.1 TraV family lipoprotein [Paraburkholderia madseniana]MCX4176674.1 TraV family lipoprotein [Paraburkholderia madseniana]MDN7153966.1 TraV family lipoprotein [Paraburkholderia sp. WS6]MDQ6412848.1 TraV family lipoprotein [Paraburkholderia madseniana]MDQ6464665.1 TraV family lipoprotein [Paraburkholderia madseniana]